MYVITIRKWRKKKCQERLGSLASYVKWWGGVNGEQLPSIQELKRQKIITDNPSLNRGKVGCYKSHQLMWKKIVQSQAPMALILEDDVALRITPTILTRITKGLQEIQHHSSWDVFLLARNHRRAENQQSVGKHTVRTGSFWGLFAYVVSLKGAEKLLQLSDQTIHLPIDVLVSRLGLKGKLNVFALKKSICQVDYSCKSDTTHIK